jgi:aspartyl-tRNA(Asn)/glutamyl-tRNA(Gln) amidotransferase subunit A
MIAFASSLDQGGPITQTVEDAAYMLDALCGYDPKDSTSSQQPVPLFSTEMKKHPKDLKIAIPRVFIEALDTGTQQQFQAVQDRLHDLGMKTEFIDFDIAEVVIPTYYVLAPAEASSNLARYDGVRYGHRSTQGTTLKELYKNSRGEGFGDEVKRRILMGTYVLSSGHYDAYYQRAQKIRLLLKKRFAEIFQKFDLVATPTALSEAFKLKAHEHDPVAMYYSDLCTVSTNLASLPAISLPLMQRHGLPLGFQLIGKSFDEVTLLQVGYALQKQQPWHHTRSLVKA